MNYILFFAGFILLIRGAEWLITGATVLAKKLGISELLIGLTVVAFGTSLPELVVNLFASGSDSPGLAIGNILGSNVANILLILGVAAIFHPLVVHRATVFREVVFNIMASCILAILVADAFIDNQSFEGLSTTDGYVLISYFIIFLYYTFGRSKISLKQAASSKSDKKLNLGTTFLKILLGSVGLTVGGHWIVQGALSFSELFNVSDTFIGITIVALGTSLPELAASVTAARRGQVDIAVGNVMGSNLFNILWVLGLSASISPLAFSSDQFVDVIFVIISSVVLLVAVMFLGKKHEVRRSEGIMFLVLYVAYLAYLTATNLD